MKSGPRGWGLLCRVVLWTEGRRPALWAALNRATPVHGRRLYGARSGRPQPPIRWPGESCQCLGCQENGRSFRLEGAGAQVGSQVAVQWVIEVEVLQRVTVRLPG